MLNLYITGSRIIHFRVALIMLNYYSLLYQLTKIANKDMVLVKIKYPVICVSMILVTDFRASHDDDY